MDDFKSATDSLGETVTHDDLARELAVSVQGVRQARLDPSHPNYRNPPDGWEAAVAKLARKRARALDRLADGLEG